MWPKRFIKIIFVLIVIFGLIIAGLYLNSAVYHLWLADGPPTNDTEYHLNTFFWHLSIALVCSIVSVVIFIFGWKRLRNAK